MNKFWTLLITISLVAVVVVGLILIWPIHNQRNLLELHLTAPAAATGNSIYVGGAVNNPGFYPLKSSDTIETLLQAVAVLIGAVLTTRPDEKLHVSFLEVG